MSNNYNNVCIILLLLRDIPLLLRQWKEVKQLTAQPFISYIYIYVYNASNVTRVLYLIYSLVVKNIDQFNLSIRRHNSLYTHALSYIICLHTYVCMCLLVVLHTKLLQNISSPLSHRFIFSSRIFKPHYTKFAGTKYLV